MGMLYAMVGGFVLLMVGIVFFAIKMGQKEQGRQRTLLESVAQPKGLTITKQGFFVLAKGKMDGVNVEFGFKSGGGKHTELQVTINDPDFDAATGRIRSHKLEGDAGILPQGLTPDLRETLGGVSELTLDPGRIRFWRQQDKFTDSAENIDLTVNTLLSLRHAGA
ncbi:MAG: hypothetical protein KC561_03840 [Myxococcales bacterium]|nr:hypothetical protein [Myxococcales bacterium]